MSVTAATDNAGFSTDTVNRSLALVTAASMVVMSGFAHKMRLHSSGTPAKNCWNNIMFYLSSSSSGIAASRSRFR